MEHIFMHSHNFTTFYLFTIFKILIVLFRVFLNIDFINGNYIEIILTLNNDCEYKHAFE